MSGDHDDNTPRNSTWRVPCRTSFHRDSKGCRVTWGPSISHPRSHPGLLLQPSHHDDGGCALLPHHPPEIAHGFGQGALCGNVGILLAVAVDVVGVDVVTARDTYGGEGTRESIIPGPSPPPTTPQGTPRTRGPLLQGVLSPQPARRRAGDGRGPAPGSPSMEVRMTREWS